MVDPIIFIFLTIVGASLAIKVTSTHNPVYSGLYLVLLFFLGSAISFLLGVEFMALLFLLVYAGAIAVLVLFVVMMLDVKAVENPWSVEKKRLFYICMFFFSCCLIFLLNREDSLLLFRIWSTNIISSLVSFNVISHEINTKIIFPSVFDDVFVNFFRLWSYNESIYNSFGGNTAWFISFDSACALNDPSYLLYSTHAILLIISGIVLLVAMVGAISLTLQKNCPESLYKQLGRESKNAVFTIKDKPSSSLFSCNNLKNLIKND